MFRGGLDAPLENELGVGLGASLELGASLGSEASFESAWGYREHPQMWVWEYL